MPFAIIPLLKFSMNKSLMKKFTINKIELFLLAILSAAIIALTILTAGLLDSDFYTFDNPWLYISYIGIIIYLVMLFYACNSNIDISVASS